MVLHQVKNWQNWKIQGCFMQFLRLIFVRKLQGASPSDPHWECCPLDPHWGSSAAPSPHFSADFSILNSHACLLWVSGRGDLSLGVNMGSDSISQKLSDENVNRGLVCAHMHSIARTLKILNIHVLDRWMLVTKTASTHHPQRRNVTTSMIGWKNGPIGKSLTQNGEPQRYSWKWRRGSIGVKIDLCTQVYLSGWPADRLTWQKL